MKQQLAEIAARVMKVPVEDALKHCKEIQGHGAFYFWNPARGGIAVIVNEQGEKLGATSSVSFEKHLNAFLDGQRN